MTTNRTMNREYINNYNQTIDEEIISYLQKFKLDNDNGTVFIGPGHSFDTKKIVEKAKRHYDQKFLDKNTKKLFHTYTTASCNTLISSLDFDIKDIVFNSKSNDTTGQTHLLRELSLVDFRKSKFDTLLNKIATRDVIDGSVVTRTEEKDGKPQTYVINMSNFWTEFDSENPDKFLERVLVNTNDLPESWGTVSDANTLDFPNTGTVKKGAEVWIYEGMCPLYYVTEDRNDTTMVWMRISTTNLFTDAKVQEKQILGKDVNDSKYDYAQLVSHEARFIGVGIPELLFDIQRYLNMDLTARYKRGQISALGGLLTLRKNAGLTTDLLDRMTAGSAVSIEENGDIGFVSLGQVGQDSFQAEQALTAQGDRVTGATEVARGQRDRQTTLGQTQIEAAFSGKRFDYMRQNLATMIVSIIYKRSKIIIDNMKPIEVVRVLDENVRADLAKEYSQAKLVATMWDAFKTKRANGSELGIFGVKEALKKFNADSWFDEAFVSNEWELRKDFAKNLDYEVEISVSNQFEDKQAQTNNLIEALKLADIGSLDKQLLVDKMLELSGINKAQYKGSQATATPTGMNPLQMGAGMGQQING